MASTSASVLASIDASVSPSIWRSKYVLFLSPTLMVMGLSLSSPDIVRATQFLPLKYLTKVSDAASSRSCRSCNVLSGSGSTYLLLGPITGKGKERGGTKTITPSKNLWYISRRGDTLSIFQPADPTTRSIPSTALITSASSGTYSTTTSMSAKGVNEEKSHLVLRPPTSNSRGAIVFSSSMRVLRSASKSRVAVPKLVVIDFSRSCSVVSVFAKSSARLPISSETVMARDAALVASSDLPTAIPEASPANPAFLAASSAWVIAAVESSRAFLVFPSASCACVLSTEIAKSCLLASSRASSSLRSPYGKATNSTNAANKNDPITNLSTSLPCDGLTCLKNSQPAHIKNPMMDMNSRSRWAVLTNSDESHPGKSVIHRLLTAWTLSLIFVLRLVNYVKSVRERRREVGSLLFLIALALMFLYELPIQFFLGNLDQL
jgi:hypothetical protein